MWWRWFVLTWLIGGCGRVSFDPVGDGTPALWWDAGWAFRKALVVDHNKVADDLTDFPVLVEIDDPDLAAKARATGGDIAFVDAANQPLAYEVERYAAGSLIAWVRIPLLPSTTDERFYMYYGGPDHPHDATTVWSNHFVSVVHFADLTTAVLFDSTGVNPGTVNSATASTGMIGGAARYTGVSGSTSPTTGADRAPGGLNTATFWVDYTGPFGKGPFVFDSTNGVYDAWMLADGCFGFNTGNSEALGATMTGLRNRWIYVAAVFYNGVPDATHNAIYIDGVAQPLSLCAGTSSSAAIAGTVAYWGGNPTYEMTGSLDEGRIANVARSPAWIATEFANQSQPASFVHPETEQAAP